MAIPIAPLEGVPLKAHGLTRTIEREHVCEIPGPMQSKFDLQLR